MESYLNNRLQFVEVGSKRSEILHSLPCSSIQGSKMAGVNYTIYCLEIPLVHKIVDHPSHLSSLIGHHIRLNQNLLCKSPDLTSAARPLFNPTINSPFNPAINPTPTVRNDVQTNIGHCSRTPIPAPWSISSLGHEGLAANEGRMLSALRERKFDPNNCQLTTILNNNNNNNFHDLTKYKNIVRNMHNMIRTELYFVFKLNDNNCLVPCHKILSYNDYGFQHPANLYCIMQTNDTDMTLQE